MVQTWFITGSSRGLGNAITRAALGAGNRVAATARRPEQLGGLAGEHGDRFAALPLDVTDPEQARMALAAAHERFGRIDVVVNNAGYAHVAPIETADDEDFRAQFETNFWGVYHVSRAATPILRRDGGGLIVQISSIGGRVGSSPGIASYQAAKFAIDGFSRVLRAETKPFGIRVLVVEPSGFRTDWAGSSMVVHDIPEQYAATVGAMNDVIRRNPAEPPGDPDRAGYIIVEVAKRCSIPEHLTLGVVASEMAIAQDQQRLEEDRRWAAVSRSADASEPFPVDMPADTQESWDRPEAI